MTNSPQICLNRPLGKEPTQSSFCQGLLRCASPELMDKFIGLSMLIFGFVMMAFNPAVGVLVALFGLIVTWNSERTVSVRSQDRDRVPCPHCAELIQPKAKVCRFSGARFR
jgi:hypothetical protein